MTITIRTASPDDLVMMYRQTRESFGSDGSFDETKLGPTAASMDFDRFRVVDDGALGRMVGVSGMYSWDITLPGGATVPMGGLTWVSVSPGSRRQGVLRRMLEDLHADSVSRGEPLAGLLASEGTIYNRFGYAIATIDQTIRVDKRFASFDERFVTSPARGDVVVLPAEDESVPSRLHATWDRYRRGRVGELSRTEAWHRRVVARRGTGTIYAFHAEGHACWTVTPDWNPAPPHHLLTVQEFAAATPAARDALLAMIFGSDLVGPIEFSHVPFDDPLPYLLNNPRLAVTTGVEDHLWLRVQDFSAVFGARTYATDDDFVIETTTAEGDSGRWSIGAGGCRRVRRKPDVVVHPSVLGALVLGGISLHTLAAARRVEARSLEILRRADLAIRTNPQPNCQTFF